MPPGNQDLALDTRPQTSLLSPLPYPGNAGAPWVITIGEGLYAEYARQGAVALSKLTDGIAAEDMLGYVKAAWDASDGTPKAGAAQ